MQILDVHTALGTIHTSIQVPRFESDLDIYLETYSTSKNIASCGYEIWPEFGYLHVYTDMWMGLKELATN